MWICLYTNRAVGTAGACSLDRGNIDFTVRESSIIQEEKSRGYIGGHVNILCVDKNSRQVLRHRAGVAVAGGDDS